MSTISRMKGKPEMSKAYNAVIKDQLEKCEIEEVNEGVKDGSVHSIPDHAVVTPHKSTTKLRMVFDVSAKSKKSYSSLNECLYRGLVILQHLCGVLLRFRL